MTIFYDCEQGTPEWFAARRGRITSSKMADVLRMSKAYARDIRKQRDGHIPDHIDAPALRWGTECEPMAAAAYELSTGVDTVKAGFYVHDEMDFLGGSPDPLVVGGGFTEIKCPYNPENHINTILLQKVPEKHIPQIQTNLILTGEPWCDFISFDPRQPVGRDIFIKRVFPDPEYHKRILAACQAFWRDLVLNDGAAQPDPEIPSLF